MNKVYKVVRSQTTGQSTVTSELAKGKTKSTSSSLTKITALLGSVGMALSGTSAFAATCNTLANGTYSCVQSTTNENLSYTVTGDTAPIVLDARTTAGSEGSASIHLTDSHVVAAGAHGILARGKGASIVLDGTNSITLGSADDTAILSMGNYGAGANGSITVNGRLDININRAGMTNSDGLEAYGIDSNISHHGTGTITTNGGNGILTSAANNATVLIDGGAVLNISGANNHGIKISANTGNVKVDSNATMIISGNNGVGIFANGVANNISNIDITNTGNMTTSGLQSNGIYTAAGANSTGNVNVTNTGNITTTGLQSIGIFAKTNPNLAGSGKVTVNNSGNITTSNGNMATSGSASAIFAGVSNPNGISGGVEINQTGGTLTTTGYDSHGLYSTTNAISGDVNITMTDTIIDLKGRNSDGIHVQRVSSGNVNTASNVNINITTNGGEIKNLDGVVQAPTGSANYGIVAIQYEAAAGNINITNNGTKISIGLGQDGAAGSSAAVYADFKNTTATGNINIVNKGELSTKGKGSGSSAIYAIHSGSGETNVTNDGKISTTGDGAVGIYAYASSTNKLNISNTGTITTNGVIALASSHGISGIMNGAGEMNITNDGFIHIQGAASRGILATGAVGSTMTVNNNGEILHDSSGAHEYGIEVLGGNNTNKTVNNNGQITGSNFGIVVWDGGSVHTGAKSTINIGSQGLVDALHGITADMSDENTINIANGGAVNGKYTAIEFRSKGTLPKDTVNNAGVITSGLDQVLQSSYGSSSATLAINNQASGEMTGVMTTNAANTVLNNEGIWNIRQVADTDRDGTRETLSVAVSNFGSLGNNSVVNNGVIKLLGDAGEASTLVNTGEYNTGFSANIMALGGAVQGHLLGVNSFTNKGEIDLTANSAVGDVLVITGGATAGANGNGSFISDGGSLKLDTVLNEGDINSQSDILVIDNATKASGATKLYINQTGTGALTQGEGIKVIETLGSSSADSFVLGKPVAAGLYEYMLNQGSADQNWYLTSLYKQTPADEGQPIFNPSTGAYLANQSAASGLFMHTLYDRQGHANNIAGGSAEKPSVWVRAATSHSRNQSGNNTMGTKTDASLIHLGGDVGKWQNEDGNFHLGLMGAYGQTDSDVVSQITHTTANGKVTGYALGVYGTWFADEAQGKGLYVDGWAQYGWYKNKVSGQAQVNSEEKYDSTNWTASLEAGYGMLVHREDNTDLMFTPQVQITYNNYSADDHRDGNNLNVSGSDASGVITRVGARLHGKAVEGYGARPFIEANWIHNTAKNELNFNGEVLKDQLPADTGELKLGLQGTIAKNWKVWGQVGGQFGSKNYERYEGQVGVNYQW